MPFDPRQPTTWVVIRDGSLCPDCKALAGMTKPWGEWIASGVLPGNGHTICGDWCRCMLVPEDWARDYGEPPIIGTELRTLKPEEVIAAGKTSGAALNNELLRWEVMMERESGYATDPLEDMMQTVKIVLSGNKTDIQLLRDLRPMHYKMINQLLGL